MSARNLGVLLCTISTILVGCQPASTSSGELPPSGASLPCRAGSCGDARLRSAIPTRSVVRIDFGREAAPGALLDVSPYYADTELYVGSINDLIDAIFADLEYAAGEAPSESAGGHEWRASVDDGEVVLDLVEAGPDAYALAYYEGPAGFDPELDGTPAIVSGTVMLRADDDYLQEFSLLLDLDALAAADPDLEASGQLMLVASQRGDAIEVQFHASEVRFGDDEEAENSRTTYWVFAEDDYALEYLTDFRDGTLMTVYVRWNDEGGRWDGHAEIEDPDLGLLDVIATNCWAPWASEVFAANATIDQDLSFYGEIDGDEVDCAFGPVSDHPDPGDDFVNLPGEGEWQAIEFLGCDPVLDPACGGAACSSDEDCDGDEVCDDGACVSEGGSDCISDADCADDEVCEAGSCIPDSAECIADEDCFGDEVCEAGSCVPDDAPECVVDEDCFEDEICEAGTCVFF